MITDNQTLLTLRTIQERAGDKGIAWWNEVGPILAPEGVDSEMVEHLRSRGLIEPSREIGFLRLTPKGLSLIS